MQNGTIRKLLYGVCVCLGDYHSLKLVGYLTVGYLPVQAHKPYNYLLKSISIEWHFHHRTRIKLCYMTIQSTLCV